MFKGILSHCLILLKLIHLKVSIAKYGNLINPEGYMVTTTSTQTQQSSLHGGGAADMEVVELCHVMDKTMFANMGCMRQYGYTFCRIYANMGHFPK